MSLGLRAVIMVGALAVVGALLLAAYVRLAPSAPARWDVDPLSAPETGNPNSWRIAPADLAILPVDATPPIWDMPATALAEAFEAMAVAQPRTRRLAGTGRDACVTYVQRSRFWGFPDYISVCFIELPGDRSTLAIYSRARFGSSDFGQNRARAEGWLAALPAP